MHWSYGRGRIGQTEDTIETDWNEFTALVHDASHMEGTAEKKHDHTWVAPFLLDNLAHRTINNVVGLGGWFALDLDALSAHLDTIRYRLYGTAFVAYTTVNSRPDAQRWRLFILLSRNYTVEEHARLWRWFVNKFQGYIDLQCGNVNRIHYLPAQWDGDADNVWHCQYGRAIDVDSILAVVPEAPPTITPGGSYEGALKEAPNGTPLITKHMIEQAQTAPEGGRLYRIMCQAAKRFRCEGWALTAEDLALAAGQANNQISPGKWRPQLTREAQRALTWAERNYQPQTPLERIRNRILWESRRFGR